MKVFAIRHCKAGEHLFRRVALDENIKIANLFWGIPKLPHWNPPKVKMTRMEGSEFDISLFLTAGLLLTPKALEALSPVLQKSKLELLSLPCGDQQFTIVNIIELVDCLKRPESCLFNEGAGSAERYVFKGEMINKPLFKIPETCTGSILVPEWIGDPSCEFKAAVEFHGLKGVRFDLLWEEGVEDSGQIPPPELHKKRRPMPEIDVARPPSPQYTSRPFADGKENDSFQKALQDYPRQLGTDLKAMEAKPCRNGLLKSCRRSSVRQ